MRTVHRSLLAGIILCFVGVNARWLWLYRHGQPLDIDEAGYLGISLNYYYHLVNGGIFDWIRTIESSGSAAPFTSVLSSLCYLVFGPHIIVGFLVPLLAGAVVIATIYFLGESLSSCRVGLTASVLVASCPIIINCSRSYYFALPATAVTAVALLALLRSDRFADLRWSSLFGICLGLMPLTRTMTIAFLPGIVLGAAMYAIASSTDRRRRLLVLTWSLFLAVITASTWLIPNGSHVFPYLLSFGYGARATEYGTQLSIFSINKWLHMSRLFIEQVYLPHFLVMIAGAIGLIFIAVRHFGLIGPCIFVRDVMNSRVFPVLIFIIGAITALASTQNQGSAFIAPVAPALIVITVWSLHRIDTGQLYSTLLLAFVIAASIIASIPLVNLKAPFARPWYVAIPMLDSATVTDGRAYIQQYEASGGFGSKNTVEPIDPISGRAWVALSGAIAAKIEQLKGENIVVAFGFRHYVFNVNTVILQQLLSTKHRSDFRQIEPVVTGDTISGYRKWLTDGEVAGATLLLLTDGHLGEILPAVNLEHMRDAAEQLGFTLVERWTMPNGQGVTMWKRALHSTPESKTPSAIDQK